MHKQPEANSRSQPTARVANQNRRRRDVVPVDRAARLGTQPTESGSTHSAHSGAQNSSPSRILRPLLARPAKRPRRDTLHTVAYNDHEAAQDEDGQQITEIFHLSDDSSDDVRTLRYVATMTITLAQMVYQVVSTGGMVSYILYTWLVILG